MRLLLIYLKKKNKTVNDNSSIRIYINKTENWITFRTKTGYYLELLTSETMKLLGSNKSEITKNKKWWKFVSFRN